MKISSKTEYALKTVLDLAMHRNEGVTHVSDIAERQNIPQKFLEQILLTLKGAGIVASRRGVNGGYFLNRSPAKITLASIVSMTEDSLASVQSSTEPGKKESSREWECPFREVWADISGYVMTRLEGTTIQDMCSRAEELSSKKVPNYAI